MFNAQLMLFWINCVALIWLPISKIFGVVGMITALVVEIISFIYYAIYFW